MTVRELIQKSMRIVGVDPTQADGGAYKDALDHLNLVISNFAFWKADDQPIDEFTSLDADISLPMYYLDVFELLLAVREGMAYHIPLNEIQYLESKIKVLTDKLIYRQQELPTMKPTTLIF